ncbi:hypothetical protein [uncultured Aquimarina sp.]|uniref:hypothetical protein n=1 Tax=uncultured Aquimarina sp. TaxID=575652 RepID=UPI0026082D5B|nr:hypothetical protein [uncultured Aquimarina sp.]
MEPEIKRVIQRLERENLIIEIKDLITGTSIISNKQRISGSIMIEQSGSIDNWLLENVKDKGYEKIQIQLFSPRGNTAVREGLAVNMGFGEKPAPKENRTVEPTQVASMTQGLNAPGMSFPEQLSLHVDRHDLQRLKSELQLEKEKTERLSKEKELLEEDKRQLEKSNDNKKFWGDLVKEVSPALKGFASMAQSQGLNAPQQPTIPEGAKGELIQIILGAEGISQEQVNAVYYVLEGFSENNTEFAQELQQLLIKHKITPDGNSNG